MTTTYIIIAIVFVLVVVVAVSTDKLYQKMEWYRQRLFELTDGKEGNNLVEVVPQTPPPPPPVHRMVRRWRFIKLENAGDNHTLNRTVESFLRDGYEYMPSASVAGVLAFVKYEEDKE